VLHRPHEPKRLAAAPCGAQTGAAIFSFLLFPILLLPAGHSRTVTMDPPPSVVDRYGVFEAVFHVTGPVAKNPFTEVALTGDFTPVPNDGKTAEHAGRMRDGGLGVRDQDTARTASEKPEARIPDPRTPRLALPSALSAVKADEGETVAVRGFCDSSKGSLFRIRFCPQKACDYSFSITYRDAAGSEEFTGQFRSVEAQRKGFIRVDPEYPSHFMFENGGHLFICSKTAWVIGDSDNWQGFLDKMLTRKENCIRFGIETDYYHETIGKDVWPWGGSRSNPDFARFSPPVWQKLESIIAYAAERDIYSEPVIFCSVRRENPTSPDPEMEFYWDYLLARLSAFTGIITWQLYNEYASAKSYQAYMAEYIRDHDPYNHLICSSAGTTNDAIWPTEPWMDIAINHSCTGDDQLNSRYHAIATRIHQYGKPAWCDETGRENRHGNNSGVHRRKQYWTWNICGDYWSYHSWEGCEGIEDLSYNGPGSEYLQFIRPFWEKTEWWRMQPADERILNDPLSQYEWCIASDTETVVYMVNEAEAASTTEGNIELAVGAGPFEAVFYSPADGSYYDAYKRGGYHPGGKLSLTHPEFVDDIIVYVKHARGPALPEKTLNFTPVADTYADKRNPTESYGDNPDLRVGGGDAERIVYLRFDVQGIEGEILSATLSLTCINGSVEGGGSAYTVGNDWEENTLTWNTRPEVAGKPFGSIGPVSVGSTYDLNVASAVTGDAAYSFALISRFQDGAGYDSREGSSSPVLKVTCRVPTPPVIAGLRDLGTDGFQLSWAGPPEEEHRLEYSLNLVSWSEASSLPDFALPFHEDGSWSWLDLSSASVHTRFYRVGW